MVIQSRSSPPRVGRQLYLYFHSEPHLPNLHIQDLVRIRGNSVLALFLGERVSRDRNFHQPAGDG
jgi:hypothetical protein